MDTKCSICFDEVTNACVTPCGHMYCLECIEEWLRRSQRCPICNSYVTRNKLIILAQSNEPHVEENELDNDNNDLRNRNTNNNYNNNVNNNQERRNIFQMHYDHMNEQQKDNLYKCRILFFVSMPFLILFGLLFLMQLHINDQ